MRFFRSLVVSVIVSSMVLFVLAGCAGSDEIVVGHDSNFVPFEYRDSETGDYVGFDIDLVAAIAEEAGFEYRTEPMAFDGLIPSIMADKIDMAAAGMTITEARQEEIDFSRPYYDSGLHLMVHIDNDDITAIEDLEGKVVATRSGTTSYNYLRDHELVDNDHITPYENIIEAYQELETGAADAVFFDSPALLRYAATEGEGKVKIVGPLYEGQQYGFGFEKGDELRDQVDEALETLIENGTYAEIYEKWFGEKPE